MSINNSKYDKSIDSVQQLTIKIHISTVFVLRGENSA